MAGKGKATWVKVKGKGGRMTTRAIGMTQGGGKFSQGQVITQTEFNEVRRKAADRKATPDEVSARRKMSAEKASATKLERYGKADPAATRKARRDFEKSLANAAKEEGGGKKMSSAEMLGDPRTKEAMGRVGKFLDDKPKAALIAMTAATKANTQNMAGSTPSTKSGRLPKSNTPRLAKAALSKEAKREIIQKEMFGGQVSKSNERNRKELAKKANRLERKKRDIRRKRDKTGSFGRANDAANTKVINKALR